MLYIRVQDNSVTPQVLVIELAPVFTLFVATGHTIVIFTRQFLTLLLNKSCRAVVQPEYREYAFHILQFVAPSPILSLWLAATGAALGNKTLLFRHWVSMWL